VSRSFTPTMSASSARESESESEPWVLPSLVVATTSLCVFDLYRLLTLLAA
jgi:hypothetical protein